MAIYIEPIAKLISSFAKLPSVGLKSAQRNAFAIIKMSESDVKEFCDALMAVKKDVHFCKICGNYTDKEVCDICSTREHSTICVVKEPKDVISIEKMREYRGVYHVLQGALCPSEKIGPDDIKIKELIERINKGGVKEVIIALNSDPQGDATAFYISTLLKPLGVKVTKLAHGIPIGADIEYADEVTLSMAFSSRRDF